MDLWRRSFLKRSSAMFAAALAPPAAFDIESAFAQTGAPAAASSTGGGPPTFVCTDFSHRIDPAYLSSGLVGIRPGPNPLARALTLVSGFVFKHFAYGMETISPAPYPLATDIRVNRVSLLERPDLITFRRQQLDTATGELLTDLVFSAEGVTLQIQVLQFASRSIPSLLCQEIRLVPYQDGDLEFAPSIAMEGVPGRVYRDAPPERTEIDLVMGLESHGDLSRLGEAISVLTPDGLTRKGEQVTTAGGVTRSYFLAGKQGQPIRFQTVAALVSQLYHSEPDLEAVRLARWGSGLGFDLLRSQHRRAWSDLWKSRVRISGDTDDQRLLDAAFFYLQSSLHPSNQTGMPPFGLSQFDHYYGHSFWDTETWSLLPVAITSPETARSLLEYRLRGLPAARRLAALFGYRGAQFPWEAGQIDGSEVTPTFAQTGWREQHVTLDVALCFWEYQLATDDAGFLREGTWPVLQAVAEWIESRGIETGRGFEIQHIMGPNERIPDTTNNAYVNIICKMVLAAAQECARQVGAKASPSWKRIQDTLVIPLDQTRQVILPYDNAQPGAQEGFGDLDRLTIHDPPLSSEIIRRTYDYENQTRGPRSSGIGFSTAARSATAAFMGDRKRARELFDQSWKNAWLAPFGMIRESPRQDYGCFLTNFGSPLQTAMLGFTGLRIRQGDWRAYPATLPEGWSRIEIDRLWVRGQPKRLIAVSGRLAELKD